MTCYRYLRQIKKAREAQRRLVYTDETWVNAGHCRTKQWQANGRSARPRGAAPGKGQRLIVTDAGGVEGFVEGCEMTFVSKTNQDDYHQEMNGPV